MYKQSPAQRSVKAPQSNPSRLQGQPLAQTTTLSRRQQLPAATLSTLALGATGRALQRRQFFVTFVGTLSVFVAVPASNFATEDLSAASCTNSRGVNCCPHGWSCGSHCLPSRSWRRRSYCNNCHGGRRRDKRGGAAWRPAGNIRVLGHFAAPASEGARPKSAALATSASVTPGASKRLISLHIINRIMPPPFLKPAAEPGTYAPNSTITGLVPFDTGTSTYRQSLSLLADTSAQSWADFNNAWLLP